MALRMIRETGEDVLRAVCKPVKMMTPRLEELIEDMYETMYDADGVGLAAPQVGIRKRLCVVDVTCGEVEGEGITLINPEILEADGEVPGREGCLSVPGKYGYVIRPEHIKVRFLNEDMEEVVLEAEGLLARAIQHEMDHLDGILYVDKIQGELHDVGDEYDGDDEDEEYEEYEEYEDYDGDEEQMEGDPV